ncbi:13436_t:CDS:1, partial [Dentiscutata erythropus]
MPPLYPTFGITNAIKQISQFQSPPAVTSQLQSPPAVISQLQLLFAVILQLQSPLAITYPGSIPSLREFFEALDGNYNDNGAYKNLIEAFEKENVTINGIKNLNKSELLKLEVTKI